MPAATSAAVEENPNCVLMRSMVFAPKLGGLSDVPSLQLGGLQPVAESAPVLAYSYGPPDLDAARRLAAR
jgi:hypothetical protein